MNDGRLDALLSSPLPEVADDGFSHRTMARIENRPRYALLELAGFAVAALLLLFFLPWGSLSIALARFSVAVGTSLPLAVAALAIVFSGWFSGILER